MKTKPKQNNTYMNTLKHTLAKLEIFQLNQQTVNVCTIKLRFGNAFFSETATKVNPPPTDIFHSKLVKVPLYLNKKTYTGGTERFWFY